MTGFDLAELDDHALAIDDGDRSSIAELAHVTFASVPVLLEALILRDAWRQMGNTVKYRTDYALAASLKVALAGKQTPVGLSKEADAAFLPLRSLRADGLEPWQHAFGISAMHMMQSLQVPKKATQAVCGALGELIGNIFDHSDAAATGLVGAARREGAFEFCVADAGRGVLAGYKANPKFDGIADEGRALELAVCRHVSRLDDAGRGNGFRVLLQALSSLDADIRVRSGRAALLGAGSAGNRGFTIAQKGELRGFVVSVSIK